MTDTPFSAPFLKVDRAKRHLAELESVIADYLAKKPIRWSGNIEVRDRVAQIKLGFEQDPVPPEVSSILGDIIHNLRSSLDLLASDLCRMKGESPEDAYFPFCDEQPFLPKMIKQRHFDRAGPEAVKLLMELKPYKGGNIALRAIHDLDIQDKHQRLIVNQIHASSPIIDLGPEEVRGKVPPKFVGDPTEPSEVKLTFPADCALAGQDLIPTLHDLVETTAAIIERFKVLVTPAG